MLEDHQIPDHYHKAVEERHKPKPGKPGKTLDIHKIWRALILLAVAVSILMYVVVNYAPDMAFKFRMPGGYDSAKDLADEYALTVNKSRMRVIKSSCMDAEKYATVEAQDACWQKMASESKVVGFCDRISDSKGKVDCRASVRDYWAGRLTQLRK